MEGWLTALRGELAMIEGEGLLPLAPRLDTLFVGGGTPSLLGPHAMDGLAGVLGLSRLAHASLEWTAEANPESFTMAVAQGWRNAGVNRVSLGVQSFSDSALRWMGRLHRGADSAAAVDRARAAGIENISLDLIFGLPDGVHRDWARDLELALTLRVPHLSLYGLSLEKGTPLERAMREGDPAAASEERYGDEFLLASRRLGQEGYLQYELSNFALPGFEARHNLVYWGHLPYLGLGNSAHSFQPPHRRWNLRDWAEYQRAVGEGRLPLGGKEELAPRDLRLEKVWMGLRTAGGVRVRDLNRAARDLADHWIGRGWAEAREGSVCLTPQGWLTLDSLAVDLDSVLGLG
jgi:oxygen-independent coproporphyrinogen-3 oxidase